MEASVYLTLEIGKKHSLTPAPRDLIEALKSVEVTQKDEGRSGFQLSFQIGRNSRSESEWKDYQILTHANLQPFSRVRIQVTVNGSPFVLMDGVITNHQFAPSLEAGASTFTVTGEDVSVMMDLEEKTKRYPQRRAADIVREIVNKYKADFGLEPEIQPPEQQDQPRQNGRIPAQQGSDLQYINALAQQHGCVFYVTPEAKNRNIAYWGMPKRQQQLTTPLSFNLGSFANVESVSFQYNALAPTKMSGQVRNREPVTISATQREPALSAHPAISSQSYVRSRKFRHTGRQRNQAQIEAQATVDKSVDNVISATCEVDSSRYGGVLQIRGVVSLRGVGHSYDGLYYIKSITHKFSKGEYKQSLSLSRDGLGTRIQKVSE
jgi:phage protein D